MPNNYVGFRAGISYYVIVVLEQFLSEGKTSASLPLALHVLLLNLKTSISSTTVCAVVVISPTETIMVFLSLSGQ